MELKKGLFKKYNYLTISLYETLNKKELTSFNNIEEILNQRQNLINQINKLPPTSQDPELHKLIKETIEIEAKCNSLLAHQFNNLKNNITQLKHGKKALNAYKDPQSRSWGVFLDNKK